MHLTFILHFDASKEADPAMATVRIEAIHKYCQEKKYNLLVRSEAYHNPAWTWSNQTLRLAYDYLWGDFNCEDNKVDGAVIVYLDSDLEAVEVSLKEDEQHGSCTVTMDTGNILIGRNDTAKEIVEIFLKKAK